MDSTSHSPTIGDVFVERKIKDANGLVVKVVRVPLSDVPGLSLEEKEAIVRSCSGAPRAVPERRNIPCVDTYETDAQAMAKARMAQ